MGKWIRRGFIVVGLILIFPRIMMVFSYFGDHIPQSLQEKVDRGEMNVHKLNEEIMLDNDQIRFKRLFTSPSETVLQYEVHSRDNGWSFPDNAVTLKTPDGKLLRNRGGSMTSRSGGSTIISKYKPIPKGTSSIIVDFDWYDRSFQTEISLEKEEL